MAEFKLPTETVELPSKGLLYPEDSPLASGTIEMKYMTAKEEDILTNTNYIQKGTVIDKLLQSLIITPGVNYNDLLIGDKNAIMIAARILSYGKDYSFKYGNDEITADLSKLENKPVDYNIFSDRKNNFRFTLPKSGNDITFKLLTHNDENTIQREIEGLKKLDKESSTDVTTRLKHIITSVNGIHEQKDIRNFVDNFLLAADAKALRDYISSISPDVELKYLVDGEEAIDIPITVGFFWPE
jgi:hypothetical protein